MVKLLPLVLISLPALLFSDTVAYPDKEKKRLSDNLTAIYNDIDKKFNDPVDKVAILQNSKTPFVTELFKDQLASAKKEDKTALIIELLNTHYDSLDKEA